MDFNHATLLHRLRLVSRLGKKSLLVSAAVVAGFALKSKFHAGKGSLQALTLHPDFETRKCTWDFNWDKRDPDHTLSTTNEFIATRLDHHLKDQHPATPRVATAKRHILLIRHGQYADEADTDDERILTNLGRFQAKKTARRLEELNLPYSRLTASTMKRAQETADLICQELPYLDMESDDVLREGAPIHPVPPTESWQPHPSQFFQDGARIENAFRKYIHRADPEQKDDSFEVVVCHSNIIRYFACRALQFPLSGWIRLSIANCSLTMITIHPDGSVVLEMMGDHGHIPAESVTYH